jgi:WD40 repeat protein
VRCTEGLSVDGAAPGVDGSTRAAEDAPAALAALSVSPVAVLRPARRSASPTPSHNHEMTARDAVELGRPVLQEFATGLTDCRSASVMPGGPVAVVGNLEELAFVDLTSGTVERHALGGEWGVRSVVGLTDRRVLVVSVCDVVLYGLTGGGLVTLDTWAIESEGAVVDVAATTTGSRFAVAAGHRLYVGGAGRRDLDVVLVRPDPDCLATSLSRNGEVVAAGRGGGVNVYAGRPPIRRDRLRLDDGDVPALAIGLSPDGRRVVAGDDVTRLALFDVDTGVRTDLEPVGKAVAVDWTPDGSAVAAVGLTRQVLVYDGSGRTLARMEHDASGVNYFVGGGWTAAATRVVAGTEHGLILTWAFTAATH